LSTSPSISSTSSLNPLASHSVIATRRTSSPKPST
jgi:hypothetical protein